MEDTPTSSEGRRLLAVIVFTDVVGFTKLAGKNEQRAFEVVRQHLSLMSDLCQRNGGNVLKNTGDGLLMSFSSAVQALQCALQIQHDLHALNESLPPEEWVQHRIGVHLGDIIVTDDDVFGDGVNVAARLQQEAKPGAICLSRTVHDVVKGKLPTEPQYLGPRHLKNVVEPVMVWQFPPIGEAVSGDVVHGQTAGQIFKELGPQEEEGAKGLQAGAMVAASIVVALAGIGLIWMFTKPSGDKPKSDSPPVSKKVTPAKTDQAKADPAKTEPNNGRTGDKSQALAENAELREKQAELLKVYDFNGFAVWLESFEPAKSDEGAALVAKYKRLAEFRSWLEAQIAAAKPEKPLLLADKKVYAGQDGGIFMEDASGAKLVFLADLPPAELMSITAAAVVGGQAVPPRPIATIEEWCNLFAAEYGVSPPNLGNKG